MSCFNISLFTPQAGHCPPSNILQSLTLDETSHFRFYVFTAVVLSYITSVFLFLGDASSASSHVPHVSVMFPKTLLDSNHAHWHSAVSWAWLKPDLSSDVFLSSVQCPGLWMPSCAPVKSRRQPFSAAPSPASTTACSPSGYPGVPASMTTARNHKGRKVWWSILNLRVSVLRCEGTILSHACFLDVFKEHSVSNNMFAAHWCLTWREKGFFRCS